MPNQNPQSQKQKQTKPEKPNEVERSAKKNKWDIIDEHAWESFPASDAPASWAGRDISPAEREEAERAAEQPATESNERKQKPRQKN